jgi:membrane-associated phospholipid phosphatase
VPWIFHRLPQNVVALFRGRNLLWQLLAIVLTLIIVQSGADWAYYRATRIEELFLLARPGIRVGFFAPTYGVFVLLVLSTLGRCRRLVTTAWALGQAVVLGYVTASFYKFFTGRAHPPPTWRMSGDAVRGASFIDTSHGFHLGFYRGGIFWGWPSSHTTIAFSMSTCLIALYPGRKTLAFLCLLYAVYVGLSVSVTIHWLSEFVAGAIFGTIIGTTVGRSFRPRLAPDDFGAIRKPA